MPLFSLDEWYNPGEDSVVDRRRPVTTGDFILYERRQGVLRIDRGKSLKIVHEPETSVDSNNGDLHRKKFDTQWFRVQGYGSYIRSWFIKRVVGS